MRWESVGHMPLVVVSFFGDLPSVLGLLDVAMVGHLYQEVLFVAGITLSLLRSGLANNGDRLLFVVVVGVVCYCIGILRYIVCEVIGMDYCCTVVCIVVGCCCLLVFYNYNPLARVSTFEFDVNGLFLTASTVSEARCFIA